jgi:putative DNA methylase
MKRAIEEYFPIIDINRLAVPERNAFKPIYQMHKWFARRSSSVFRAILLGALKPAGTDIMEEFYKDHTNDPDTKGKVILDPFMGGGTTVVEALRLGCKVIGVDLNPVAWFIVKTEVEPVDIEELKKAFDRLARRTVEWSGKPLKETLLSLYKTECPACGNKDADIIYTFWVKSAPCTTATCNHETPLFPDYIISQKNPSIRYIKDYHCKCGEKFDWEREPAALVGNRRLMVNSTTSSAGVGRSNSRWVFSDGSSVHCPWCEREAKLPASGVPKLERKKVPLSVLYCPHCEEVWQHRGELPDEVECPTCKKAYNPNEGNVPEKGKFVCQGSCGGNKDTIIAAIRKLPDEQLLPTRPYGIEGYCRKCAAAKGKGDASDNQTDAFAQSSLSFPNVDEVDTLLWKNSGKFFKRVSAFDLQSYRWASEMWLREKVRLPHPKSQVPNGAETHRLLEHHYRYWHQMFNGRQLVALSTLLREIGFETNQTLKEMILSAFITALEGNNVFCRYTIKGGNKSQGIFARHDYQPKLTFTENNVWGTAYGHGPFTSKFNLVIEGKEFCLNPFDRRFVITDKAEELESVRSNETVLPVRTQAELLSQTSTSLEHGKSGTVECVITDPPYASNVNYAELADFFYVWLRLPLLQTYEQFAAELTPKAEEIIENPSRGKTSQDLRMAYKKYLKNLVVCSATLASLFSHFITLKTLHGRPC